MHPTTPLLFLCNSPFPTPPALNHHLHHRPAAPLPRPQARPPTRPQARPPTCHALARVAVTPPCCCADRGCQRLLLAADRPSDLKPVLLHLRGTAAVRHHPYAAAGPADGANAALAQAVVRAAVQVALPPASGVCVPPGTGGARAAAPAESMPPADGGVRHGCKGFVDLAASTYGGETSRPRAPGSMCACRACPECQCPHRTRCECGKYVRETAHLPTREVNPQRLAALSSAENTRVCGNRRSSWCWSGSQHASGLTDTSPGPHRHSSASPAPTCAIRSMCRSNAAMSTRLLAHDGGSSSYASGSTRVRATCRHDTRLTHRYTARAVATRQPHSMLLQCCCLLCPRTTQAGDLVGLAASLACSRRGN